MFVDQGQSWLADDSHIRSQTLERGVVMASVKSSTAAAIIVTALVFVAAPAVQAGLTLDLRAADNGAVVLIPSAGAPARVTIYAIVQGFDGRDDETLRNFFLRLSSGSSLANPQMKVDLSPVQLSPGFVAIGSNPGKQVDVDRDGDLDVGPSGGTNLGSSEVFGRSHPILSPDPIGVRRGDDMEEFYVGYFNVTLKRSGQPTVISLDIPNMGIAPTALWKQDNTWWSGRQTAAGASPANRVAGVFGDKITVMMGTPSIKSVTPEPSAFGAIALSSLALLSRRNGQRFGNMSP
jgi:hypothetical protein